MPPKSAAAKARAAAQKAKRAAKESPETGGSSKATDLQGYADNPRTCTGVLTSRAGARDIKVDSFSMTIGGYPYIEDCSIELTIGRRYGLIGRNGCGKSHFLKALAEEDVPLPPALDIYHLSEEAKPSDMSALASVVQHVKDELAKLEHLLEVVMEEGGPEDSRLDNIYERMDDLDPEKFEEDARKILIGLGFDNVMMHKATRDMSGGWRMRVSLAKALFASPTILLLDEPTNHLDLEACVWLEKFLAKYKHCLIVVSHSQDFLNGVCSHIIHITEQKLTYYTGNYDVFKRTLEENRNLQHKLYLKEQEEIKHIKQFIASCGTFANLVKQAKSRQKVLDKMIEKGLTPPVPKENTFQLRFPSCEKLPPPVMPFQNVAFSYSGKEKDYLWRGVDLAIDSDSRVALVGPNGAGKSTLVKLMTGELCPCEGVIHRHQNLRMAKYHQHSAEVLELSMTPLDFFQKKYPNNVDFSRDLEEWRKFLGRHGVAGKVQEKPMSLLSDGMKSRLVFAIMSMQHPNLVLLDEPTNHMDMEAIDSLANGIQKFEGGVILISHDFRLLDQVAKEVWLCDNNSISTWKGDIRSYKESVTKKMVKKGLIS